MSSVLDANDQDGPRAAGEVDAMSAATTTCLYCDGHGNSQAGGKCGFCKDGKPLDTQEDWDKSWGSLGETFKKVLKAIK